MIGPHTFLFQVKNWKAFLGFILITSNLCTAQENIRFERISVNEGLAQSDVKSLVQDKFGFLWIGTRNGLNRYDGVEFQQYRQVKNNPTSLHFNQILDLEVDSSGNIWIGSTGGISIYSYEKDSFENFIPADIELQEADVNDILLTGNHTAFLSTSKGLLSFDRRQKKIFIDEDLLLFKGMRILQAHQTQDHGLWVATDKGVFIKAPDRADWTRILENNSVQHIDFDRNGKVYFSTSQGLFTYDLKKKKIEQIALPSGAASVTDVMRMKNGDLWVASNKVIVLDKNDSLKYVLYHDKFNNFSLSEDRARVIFQTHDEVIWVGTFGYGLNKFNPEIAEFSYLSEQTFLPLSSNYVSSVFTADDTTLFIGTSRGLDIIDLGTRSAKHYSSSEDLFQILKIITDRKNNIWISTSHGFMQYVGNKLVLKSDFLRSVYYFTEWDDTSLILATRVNGIYLFDRETDRTTMFIPASDLPEEVSCMLIENDHVWVGCKDGLKLYDKKGQMLKHFKARSHDPESLHSSFIKSLYRDSRKNLWIGTWGGGLSLLNAKDSTFTTFIENDGLPNNVVYSILEDHSGTLWLSTNLGLSAFDFKDQTFKNFDFFDGLQSNEFNTGAYFKSASGKLYFGGINGLSFFNPGKILKHHSTPTILVTSITIDNKALTFQDTDSLRNVLMIDKIKSSWKKNDIAIKFTSINFKQTQKQHFQYSIKDTTWYDIGNRRSLELIDLPTGDHEIKVRIRTPDNRWTQPVVLLTIDIVPPVWQKAWFKIILLIVFIAVIFAAYRYKVFRLRRANAILNRLVDDRTKEINSRNEEIASQNDQLHELNKEMEAFSYSVSHDLRAPLRSIIGYSKILDEDFSDRLDEEGKRVLNIVLKNALRMGNLIDALLEFSKLGRKELKKSKIDTEKLVNEILDQLNTSTDHHAEIKLYPLPSIYGDSNLLSQVWINLISNAIKYSSMKDTPVVEISSYSEGNEIIFYVKDNGAGFDMKYADKLFHVFQRLHGADKFDGTGLGLAIVQRIVTKHGGRVWAEGKVNEGATFYFSVPK